MENELKVIKDFLLTLHKRCNHYNKAGCACSNLCGMADYCHKGLKFSEEDIEDLYKVYSKAENEYLEELEIAKKIRGYGIDYKKLEQIIDAMR